ncbi:oligosaccharide flippase family protein [Pseudogemmobacter sonorensis]|uniref:oligosaccharide flippase family protein n=1 Tax=Pseudogemmobacter sonorensis TaxID=2989681 RepID=UPI00369CA580
MAISSGKAVRAFLNSGLTVGLRSVFALLAFVVIARLASSDELAVYGIVYFVWTLIYATAQNLAAQPLVDLPRLRTADVVSARLLAVGVAFVFSLVVWLCIPLFLLLYPGFEGLESGLRSVLWLGPLGVLGSVDLNLKQRHLQFGFIARVQTVAVILASLVAIAIAYMGHAAVGMICIHALAGPFFALLALRRRRVSGARPSLARMRRLMRIGRHLAFEGNVAVFVIQGPVVLLGLLLPAAQLSIFVVCSRFIQLIASQLGRIANLVLLPMVRREARTPERLHRTVLVASYFSNGLVAAPLIAMFAAPHTLLTLLGVEAGPQAISALLLLVVKQLLDTSANTVFVTFRAIGRPDAGWRWSLMFSCVWLAMASATWAFDLGLVQVCGIIAATGFLQIGAVLWLCRTLDMSSGRYAGFMAPVLVAVLVALVAAHLLAGVEIGGWSPLLVETLGASVAMLGYLGVIVGAFRLLRTGRGGASSGS